MGVGHSTAGGQSLMRVGVVESEALGAHVCARVARQLAQKSQAFVPAKLFDGATPPGKHS
jgi:hypothetical protein